MMEWYPKVVLYMGMLDGGLIMFGGLVVAVAFLMKWNIDALWERVFPAVLTLIGSNVAAALILGATRWWVR